MDLYYKLRNLRNEIMHSGTYALNDDELNECIDLMTTMVHRTLGINRTSSERKLFTEIQKVKPQAQCKFSRYEFYSDSLHQVVSKCGPVLGFYYVLPTMYRYI